MAIKLGLYAIPFGYGPASSALTIARAINEVMDVDWHMFGSGISLEFMQREGLPGKIVSVDPGKLTDDATIKSLTAGLDGAVILMDHDWANSLAPHMPVFFSDSVGYIWPQNHFEAYPAIDRVKHYFVEDIFGSHSNMLRTGLTNIVPVPPIVDTKIGDTTEQDRFVVHLGGMLNPFGSKTAAVYMEAILQIVDRLEVESPLLLMSNAAMRALPDLVHNRDARSFAHGEALSAMANSRFVFSSPGSTCLLEMAHFGVSMAPLPPQNYSQVLAIKSMVHLYGNTLHPVWHFLAKQYEQIKRDTHEEEAVKMITTLNATLLYDSSFQQTYARLANAAMREKTHLPQALKVPESGAKVIARGVANFYGVTNHYVPERTIHPAFASANSANASAHSKA